MRKAKDLSILMMWLLGLFILGACNTSDGNELGGYNSSDSNEEMNVSNENSNEEEYENRELQRMEIHLDYHPMENLEEFADWSTDIIRGVVLDSRTELINFVLSEEDRREDMVRQGLSEEEIEYLLFTSEYATTVFDEDIPRYYIMTIYRIKIIEAFQGNKSIGDIIEVWRVGGEYEGTLWFMGGAIQLEVDGEFVLFLSENLGSFPYNFITPSQGAYHVPIEVIESTEDLVNHDEIDLELENIGSVDHIIVTIEDLIEIAAENGLLD